MKTFSLSWLFFYLLGDVIHSYGELIERKGELHRLMRDFGGANESDAYGSKVSGPLVELSVQPAIPAAADVSADPVVVAPVAAGEVAVTVAGENPVNDGTKWWLSP